MDIVEFHRMDPNNPGDWYSNPSRYFFPKREVRKIDIDEVRRTTWGQHDILIAGGGGLIGNPNFESLMGRISTHPDERLLLDVLETKIKNGSFENKGLIQMWRDKVQRITVDIISRLDKTVGPRILWGVGHNIRDIVPDSYDLEYPEYLTKFHLVGIRDWGTEHRWVPCASCMHPAFDKEYEIKNEVVWFEHKKKLVDNKCFDALPAPRMMNTGQNLEQIIEFLGSAETVITNSYHGVYWATLLKRKVVCIPWSSKFYMFKHPPTMATDKDCVDAMEDAIVYPNALADCRKANQTFFYDVIKLINETESKQNISEISTDIDESDDEDKK